jgi:hypothetical protein
MVTVDVGRFQSLGPFFNGLPAKRKSTLLLWHNYIGWKFVPTQ